ncbi:endolytic transglycosylase MltG [Haloechinothrix sp. LS1_15]|uniref:endolytic transglycosylase MltG n=1 Tax=Haloechinothrix sp. LS1_15 TaxID=2652248 RepID=UPI00294B013D|nr:endolytic transglycosylase MltG [Haloechinothrix sp. LS1_15]
MTGPGGARDRNPPRRGGELPSVEGSASGNLAGLFDDMDGDGPADRDDHMDDRVHRGSGRGRCRAGRRALGWLLILVLIGLLAAGVWYGTRELLGLNYADYAGPGEDDVIVEVAEGDSVAAIAATLEEADVVASSRAFVSAGGDTEAVRSIRPGYYVMQTRMSGADAVEAITAEDARVGDLQIRGGTKLDDVTQPDETVTHGVYSLLSHASCVELNGDSTCVDPDELRAVAAEADLTELGVPEWLAEPASEAEPERRLEGLVMPGVYSVKPGWDAERLLSEVLTVSASKLEASELVNSEEITGYEPYEVLTIASLIEHEAVENDFGRVSRVIYNRLADDMRLEMDSTINYVLERPEVRTNEEDRARPGPYNTYRNTGLPPTPISAPSMEALQAAIHPAEGSWMFFVKCEDNGLSCFADSYDEHRENVRDAQARGVY